MDKQLTGKVLISIAVASSAIVSTIVDLLPSDTGHVLAWRSKALRLLGPTIASSGAWFARQ